MKFNTCSASSLGIIRSDVLYASVFFIYCVHRNFQNVLKVLHALYFYISVGPATAGPTELYTLFSCVFYYNTTYLIFSTAFLFHYVLRLRYVS